MADIVLRWAAASDATVNTDYKVYSDYAQSGTYALVVTRNSSLNTAGTYVALTTTLNGTIDNDDTTIVLTSGTNINANDYVAIDGEVIQLGSKVTNTFSNCVRGIGASIPIAHNSGATVTVLHESYTYTLPVITAKTVRYITRLRVTRIQPDVSTSIESPAVDIIAVSPPVPTTSNLITVYGIIEDIQGNPRAGIDTKLEIQATYEWGQDTGETIRRETETYKSDSDGFFFFYVRKPSLRQNTSGTRLTIDVGGTYQTVWDLTLTDSMVAVNYLDCGTIV